MAVAHFCLVCSQSLSKQGMPAVQLGASVRRPQHFQVHTPGSMRRSLVDLAAHLVFKARRLFQPTFTIPRKHNPTSTLFQHVRAPARARTARADRPTRLNGRPERTTQGSPDSAAAAARAGNSRRAWRQQQRSCRQRHRRRRRRARQRGEQPADGGLSKAVPTAAPRRVMLQRRLSEAAWCCRKCRRQSGTARL